jgi:hypothetical protein
MCLLDLVTQEFLEGEMLEEGNNIGKALVEGEHIGVGRLEEVGALAMDDGMSQLVNDHIVRQAGEDHLAGQVEARVLPVSLEIAEEDGVQPGFVEGIGALEGMRQQAQAGIARRRPANSGAGPSTLVVLRVRIATARPFAGGSAGPIHSARAVLHQDSAIVGINGRWRTR